MSALKTKSNVLFVCTGNICRSPTAEAVFREDVRRAGLDGVVHADSAGTHGYHVGDLPDARAMETARARGVDMSDLRARKVENADFQRFDYIFAMDRGHHTALSELAGRLPHHHAQLSLFLDFPHVPSVETGRDVPDPYYGSLVDFEMVYCMVEQGSTRILREIRKRHTL